LGKNLDRKVRIIDSMKKKGTLILGGQASKAWPQGGRSMVGLGMLDVKKRWRLASGKLARKRRGDLQASTRRGIWGGSTEP